MHEVSHRIVKGILPAGFRHRDISDLIVQVCRVISSRIAAGKYSGLVSELGDTPPCLLRLMAKGSSRKDTDTPEGRDGFISQEKRLDAHRINLHYREHKAEGAFLRQSCQKVLVTGDVAICVYIFPKYRLRSL